MYVGYTRVSTTEQTLDLQKDALRGAGCIEIFEDTVLGATVGPARIAPGRWTICAQEIPWCSGNSTA